MLLALMTNGVPIQIKGSRVLLSVKYLGLPLAEVWIGPREEGPVDDNDVRVLEEREQAAQAYRSGQTNRPSGISAFTISDTDGDGYYELDTSAWPAGLYRLMYHGAVNVQTPFGQPLSPDRRDLQYSWPSFPEDVVRQEAVSPFVYYERNGRGFCFRIKIGEDGALAPAGDQAND